jgi:hypothetical protein
MFTPGAVYSWSASSTDGIDRSPTAGPCEFTVDNAAPNTAPTVASTQYPDDGTWNDGVGKTGMFTIGSNGNSDGGVNDVVAYRYGSDYPPLTEVAAPTMGGSVTVPFTPTQVGVNDFYARGTTARTPASPHRPGAAGRTGVGTTGWKSPPATRVPRRSPSTGSSGG